MRSTFSPSSTTLARRWWGEEEAEGVVATVAGKHTPSICEEGEGRGGCTRLIRFASPNFEGRKAKS